MFVPGLLLANAALFARTSLLETKYGSETTSNSEQCIVYDNVTLEDGVFCGPSVVFTNVYNPRSAVSRKDEYRIAVVEHGATLGANCTIVCGTRIGQNAFIGAGAVVNRDVKPFALVVGVPAKQIGWMSAYGERVDLPLRGTDSWICPHTGDNYQLLDQSLTRESA